MEEKREKLFVVCDDEPDIAIVLSQMIKNYFGKSCSVLTANSGKNCTELYEKMEKKGMDSDVLLLDYRLGDMVGIQVAAKIREISDTKIILMSAYDLNEELFENKDYKENVDEFMKKPVSSKYVIEKIQRVLYSGEKDASNI
jgi:CheY-like chemotaxis protein